MDQTASTHWNQYCYHILICRLMGQELQEIWREIAPVRGQLHLFLLKKKKPPPTVCMLKGCLTKKEATLFCPIINMLSRIIHYFCFPAPLLAFLGVELTKFFSRPRTSDLSPQKLTPKDISEKCPQWLPLLPLCPLSILKCIPAKGKTLSLDESDSGMFLHFYLFSNFQDGPSVWRTATIWGKAISNFNLIF